MRPKRDNASRLASFKIDVGWTDWGRDVDSADDFLPEEKARLLEELLLDQLAGTRAIVCTTSNPFVFNVWVELSRPVTALERVSRVEPWIRAKGGDPVESRAVLHYSGQTHKELEGAPLDVDALPSMPAGDLTLEDEMYEHLERRGLCALDDANYLPMWPQTDPWTAKRLAWPDQDATTEERTPAMPSAPATIIKPANVQFFSEELDADAPLPALEYSIGHLVPKSSVTMLVAYGGSMKTWTALSMALAVQSGRMWLGSYPVRHGNALVLDYESGRYEVQRRVQILAKQTPRPRIRYKWQPGNLHDAKTWDLIQRDILEHGITFCVVDSLAGGSAAEDENSAVFAAPLKAAADVSERTGCTFVFIHHARKGDGPAHEMVRGSSAIHAACDVVFRFSPVTDNGTEKTTEMLVLKPGPGPTPDPVKLRLSDIGGLQYNSATVVTGDQRRDAILRRLDQGPARGTEIESVVGGRREYVRDALKALLDDGEVVKIDRRYHRDGAKQRHERVRVAIQQGAANRTDVARMANVNATDLDAMVRDGLLLHLQGQYRLPDGAT